MDPCRCQDLDPKGSGGNVLEHRTDTSQAVALGLGRLQ